MLPFTLGSITITRDEDFQQVVDTGFIPVVARCETCGATNEASLRDPQQSDLVAMANRLSRWFCPANGHGVGF